MKIDDPIVIINHGSNLLETNYFETEAARMGFFFTSWNAGALRLLVPDSQHAALAEMASAKNVVITRGRLDGRDVYEVLFDDETQTPLAIWIDAANSDRHVAMESHGKALDVHVITRQECVGTWPGRFRVAPLPCLEPISWLPVAKSKPRWRQA